MTIETLTNGERAALDSFQDQNLDDPWIGQKAVRCIDRLTSELKELTEDHNRLRERAEQAAKALRDSRYEPINRIRVALCLLEPSDGQ